MTSSWIDLGGSEKHHAPRQGLWKGAQVQRSARLVATALPLRGDLRLFESSDPQFADLLLQGSPGLAECGPFEMSESDSFVELLLESIAS